MVQPLVRQPHRRYRACSLRIAPSLSSGELSGMLALRCQRSAVFHFPVFQSQAGGGREPEEGSRVLRGPASRCSPGECREGRLEGRGLAHPGLQGALLCSSGYRLGLALRVQKDRDTSVTGGWHGPVGVKHPRDNECDRGPQAVGLEHLWVQMRSAGVAQQLPPWASSAGRCCAGGSRRHWELAFVLRAQADACNSCTVEGQPGHPSLFLQHLETLLWGFRWVFGQTAWWWRARVSASARPSSWSWEGTSRCQPQSAHPGRGP